MRVFATLIPLVILTVVVWLALGVYVWRDAKKRGMSPGGWTAICLLLPCFVGFGIYLAARYGQEKLRCPGCKKHIRSSFIVCPYCGAELKLRCGKCGAPVEPDWKICPTCAEPLPKRTPPVEPEDSGKGLLIVLFIICILLPAAAIGGMLFLSAAPYNYNGHATGYGEMTLSEIAADRPDIYTDPVIAGWLEDCELQETPGASLIWQKHYSGEGSESFERVVSYIYLTGYSELDVQFDDVKSFFGEVSTICEISAVRDNDAEPKVLFLYTKADHVADEPPKVLVNGHPVTDTVNQPPTEMLPNYMYLPKMLEDGKNPGSPIAPNRFDLSFGIDWSEPAASTTAAETSAPHEAE